MSSYRACRCSARAWVLGPTMLHSRDRKSTAAAHDVAPRFQQYAKWARYACYDMRYETMFQDRSGEVSRLAKALQIDISKTQASSDRKSRGTAQEKIHQTARGIRHQDFHRNEVHESAEQEQELLESRNNLHKVGLYRQLPSCPSRRPSTSWTGVLARGKAPTAAARFRCSDAYTAIS